MNDINWEQVYEAILKDIVEVIESTSFEKVERITEILVANDFMEKPSLFQ